MYNDYKMRIPLIKITDKASPRSNHYIGTNIHDRLSFKNKNLVYSNVQNGDSTLFDDSGYSFENGDVGMFTISDVLDIQAEILDCSFDRDYLKVKEELVSYFEKMGVIKRNKDEELLKNILEQL